MCHVSVFLQASVSVRFSGFPSVISNCLPHPSSSEINELALFLPMASCCGIECETMIWEVHYYQQIAGHFDGEYGDNTTEVLRLHSTYTN